MSGSPKAKPTNYEAMCRDALEHPKGLQGVVGFRQLLSLPRVPKEKRNPRVLMLAKDQDSRGSLIS